MMLIEGDLVTIPQDAYIYPPCKHHVKIPRKLKIKKYGVVIASSGDDYKVLITDTVYEVNKKFLQLVETA